MAKTIGSLFSQQAHGSLSKVLTYSKRKSGQQVRRYNKPPATPSAKQRGQRRLTEFLVAHWQNMTTAERATWEANAKASGRNLPGYHYFLREAEIIGGKVLDLSGNGNHGTLQPSYPSNVPGLVTSEIPKFGKALDYDGIDEYINLGSGDSLNITDEIMIEAWTKISAGTIVSDSHGSLSPGPIEIRPDGFFLYIDDLVFPDNRYQVKFVNSPYGNKLHCVAVIRQGSTMSIIVDGQLDNSDVCSSGPMQHPTNLWSIGVSRTTAAKVGFLAGVADEICIYNRAPSLAEMSTRYRFALQKAS